VYTNITLFIRTVAQGTDTTIVLRTGKTYSLYPSGETHTRWGYGKTVNGKPTPTQSR